MRVPIMPRTMSGSWSEVCDAIPLPDQSVDLVVSFETIEHHDKHEEMMLEIKRVLRPDGVVIISSPDKQTYSIEPTIESVSREGILRGAVQGNFC